MKQVLKAAIVQDAPLPFAVTAGLEHAARHLVDAIEIGAQVIAFGEAFLGGYPLWLDAAGAATWDHPGTQELHALLMHHALRPDDPRFAVLQGLVDHAQVVVSIGGHLRVRSSLLNAQFVLRPGQPVLTHAKLMPNRGESMFWGRGDGSTLEPHAAPWGRLGNLISWDHWMPLTRAAMHHAGEDVHVAAWRQLRETDMLASRHYAFEGRCFVLAAGAIQHRAHLLEGLEMAGGGGHARDLLLRLPDAWLQQGGSAIIAPNAEVLVQSDNHADILTAELDLEEVTRGLATLDVDGAHARPDIFELQVDRRERKGIHDLRSGIRAA